MLTCGVGGQRKGWGMRSTHSTVWKQTPSALCLFKSTLPAYSLNNLGHLILIWIKFKLKAQSTQSACQKKPPLCILVHTCGKMGWVRIAEHCIPYWANSSILVPLVLLPLPPPHLTLFHIYAFTSLLKTHDNSNMTLTLENNAMKNGMSLT